jgi:putative glycosyltransferase (TIGR04348 family)
VGRLPDLRAVSAAAPHLSVALVTPAPPGSTAGNWVTAERWARLLAELGHRVSVSEDWRGQDCDVLVALHARKSAAAARRYREQHPAGKLIVALTGTDVYQDLETSAEAVATIAAADRLVALQPLASTQLATEQRQKVRVLFQSAEPPSPLDTTDTDFLAGRFGAGVLAHLRAVKDPLGAARASRHVPARSRLLVAHAGRALDPELGAAAGVEMAVNPRYRWLGELARPRAFGLLACCRLLVVSSRLEGGANVISEALALGIPILTSRIPGSLGILGTDYPGSYPVGDDSALAGLLWRCESDEPFLEELRARCRALRPLVDPQRERSGWQELLAELA